MELIIVLISIFIISYGTGYLFKLLKLPRLLGYLIVGLFVGNLLNFGDIITQDIIDIITGFALSVILLKAGLGIEKVIIKKIGFRVLLLGTIPNIIEAIIIAILSILLFDFQIHEAFMFGFIISAVSPAVVIPSMSKLMDKGYDKEVTTLNLAATSFDDVVSLTMFSIFLLIYKGEGNTLGLLLMAPVKMILGAALGGAIGFVLGRTLKHTFCLRYKIIQFVIVLAIALALKEYGSYLYVIEMIAIMVLGYFINDTNKEVSFYIKNYTNNVWKYAQVFLFFMIGFLADISLIGDYLLVGIGIIILGLVGRLLGVLISLYKSDFKKKQKIFSAIGNIPKATVQAVLGAVPLTEGIRNGDVMLSIAVLSIIFTAPIGLILIEIFGPKLLKNEQIKKDAI